jgi:peptidyl-prolyl cis-trans isomerase C
MKVKSDFLILLSAFLVGSAPFLSVQAKEIARVKDRVITDRDLALSLAQLNEGQRESILRDQNSRRQILMGLIDQEVLALEGEKLKLDQDAEFKEAMLRFRKQLLTNRLLDKKLNTQLTLGEVKKYYQNHPEKFSTDQVRVQHILLSDENEARKILKLAKDPKNDFQELAEKYSVDPSAKNNRGDIGLITRDRMTPEFSDAAFQTGEGQITGPIQTAFGYHLIKVVQRRLGKTLEFDEVELRAKELLKQQLIKNYTDEIKKQYPIKVDQAAADKG